jgi:hypothetical protein
MLAVKPPRRCCPQPPSRSRGGEVHHHGDVVGTAGQAIVEGVVAVTRLKVYRPLLSTFLAVLVSNVRLPWCSGRGG